MIRMTVDVNGAKVYSIAAVNKKDGNYEVALLDYNDDILRVAYITHDRQQSSAELFAKALNVFTPVLQEDWDKRRHLLTDSVHRYFALNKQVKGIGLVTPTSEQEEKEST